VSRFLFVFEIIEIKFCLYFSFKNKIEVDNIADLPIEQIAEPSKKITMKAFLRAAQLEMRIKLRSELPSIHPLKEVLRTAHFCLATSQYSAFNERFNEVIGRMISHGLVDKQRRSNKH
jgi:hypothetical protein